MTTGTQQSYQRAVERARALGGANRVSALGSSRYSVVGSTGDVYRVFVDADGESYCSCPAGQFDNSCWHVAAVTLARGGLPKRDPRDADSALLARPSGAGIGMVGRWADEDDRSLLDVFAGGAQMSAFVVSREHIDALTNLALFGPAEVRAGSYWSQPLYGATGRRLDGDELGQLLTDACVESVRSRYPGCRANPDATPGPVERYWERPYTFRLSGTRLSAVAALKAISYYEYQACEHPDWDASPVAAFCDALRRCLISWLPGYDEAAWEL